MLSGQFALSRKCRQTLRKLLDLHGLSNGAQGRKPFNQLRLDGMQSVPYTVVGKSGIRREAQVQWLPRKAHVSLISHVITPRVVGPRITENTDHGTACIDASAPPTVI